MPNQPRMERALFVLGKQNSGKTRRIRNMYADVRMGRDGKVPQKKQTRFPTVYLSNERRLYVRVQSPQEAGDTLAKFFKKIDAATKRDGPTARWNTVCAMQWDPGRNIGDGLNVIGHFIRKYKPERVRVAVLHPPARLWAEMTSNERDRCQKGIRALERAGTIVEQLMVPGRGRNGLLLSDFFDFT